MSMSEVNVTEDHATGATAAPSRLTPMERAEAMIARAKHRAAARNAGPHENESARSATPKVDQANEILDRAGEALGHYASLAGQGIRKVAALVREEAEDMVAEAQAVRSK